MKALRLPDEAWQTRGECANPRYNPEIWTGDDTNASRIDLAKSICQACPVIDKCLQSALDARDFTDTHVMGGLTGTERHSLVKRTNKIRARTEGPQRKMTKAKRRTSEEAQQLLAEITRRTRAGETPQTIAKALDVPSGTVSWYRRRIAEQEAS